MPPSEAAASVTARSRCSNDADSPFVIAAPAGEAHDSSIDFAEDREHDKD